MSTTLSREEMIKLLRSGDHERWNQMRREGVVAPSLAGADLSSVSLSQFDLSDMDFSGANLQGGGLSIAKLRGARFIGADLTEVQFAGTEFSNADFTGAQMRRTRYMCTMIEGARFFQTDLSEAVFTSAWFRHCLFIGTRFRSTDMRVTSHHGCTFVNVDLSQVIGLDDLMFNSSDNAVCNRTLAQSRGRIPASFLRTCGMSEWEVLAARMHAPEIARDPVALGELHQQIHRHIWREQGSEYRVWIVSDDRDKEVAQRIKTRLKARGVRVRRDMWNDARSLDAVHDPREFDLILVLASERSIHAPWMTATIQRAQHAEIVHAKTMLLRFAIDEVGEAWCLEADRSSSPVGRPREFEPFEGRFGRLWSDIRRRIPGERL